MIPSLGAHGTGETNGLVSESSHRIATSSMTPTTSGLPAPKKLCERWRGQAFPPGGSMLTSRPFSDGVKPRAVPSTVPQGQRLWPMSFGAHTKVGDMSQPFNIALKPTARHPRDAVLEPCTRAAGDREGWAAEPHGGRVGLGTHGRRSPTL